jgi:hypothetical protein
MAYTLLVASSFWKTPKMNEVPTVLQEAGWDGFDETAKDGNKTNVVKNNKPRVMVDMYMY